MFFEAEATHTLFWADICLPPTSKIMSTVQVLGEKCRYLAIIKDMIVTFVVGQNPDEA